MQLDEGSNISFEAPKTDILRPSYECLKFTNTCTHTHTHTHTTYVLSGGKNFAQSCSRTLEPEDVTVGVVVGK